MLSGPDSVTVLVVEDEHAIRTLIKEILEGVGLAVIEAANIADAVRQFQEHQSAIRLLVTDVIMPGGSGTQLVDALLQLNPELPVLFVSGYCEEHSPAMRDFGCLAKPFVATELVRRVQELLPLPIERHAKIVA